MATEETSKLSLPEKFYKNIWDIDQMKPLSATVVLSLLTPSFRCSTASSGRTIKYLQIFVIFATSFVANITSEARHDSYMIEKKNT